MPGICIFCIFLVFLKRHTRCNWILSSWSRLPCQSKFDNPKWYPHPCTQNLPLVQSWVGGWNHARSTNIGKFICEKCKAGSYFRCQLAASPLAFGPCNWGSLQKMSHWSLFEVAKDRVGRNHFRSIEWMKLKRFLSWKGIWILFSFIFSISAFLKYKLFIFIFTIHYLRILLNYFNQKKYIILLNDRTNFKTTRNHDWIIFVLINLKATINRGIS